MALVKTNVNSNLANIKSMFMCLSHVGVDGKSFYTDGSTKRFQNDTLNIDNDDFYCNSSILRVKKSGLYMIVLYSNNGLTFTFEIKKMNANDSFSLERQFNTYTALVVARI